MEEHYEAKDQARTASALKIDGTQGGMMAQETLYDCHKRNEFMLKNFVEPYNLEAFLIERCSCRTRNTRTVLSAFDSSS